MMQRSIDDILRTYWGYDSFRPLQRDIIESVMRGDDTVALLPTGGGKSLCFQVPALALSGLCVVVSPLISLMRDQVERLRSLGIKADCLESGMGAMERETVYNHILHQTCKFLYIAPERLRSRTFMEHIKQAKVSLIAVDEAHCISQWGHDFRPAYLDIVRLRACHLKAPVVALTATATPAVVNDICDSLSLRGRHVFQSSFERRNLSYMVLHENDKVGRLLRVCSRVPGSGIVYVRNRRTTEEIAALLRSAGVSACVYHAGMDARGRRASQRDWMQGLARVVVATNAFGMGIDKADVRFVVHWDIPLCPEEYFQESGRAGRDGEKAYAVLLRNDSDVERLHRRHEQSYPPLDYIKNVYRAVGNFYRIPIGSGQDMSFDFKSEAICEAYNFDRAVFFNAMRYLQREGLVDFPPIELSVSRLRLLVDREELYRVQMKYRQLSEVIVVLLRLYGGLFTDYGFIDERKIAKQCHTDEATVKHLLQRLEALQVLSYRPKSSVQQIVFLCNRVSADDVYLTESNYAGQKQQATHRMHAMERYATSSDTCRMVMLLDYFGEQSTPCGRCDVCLTGSGHEPADVRLRVIELLSRSPLSVKELAGKLPTVSSDDLVAAVRSLLDHRQLVMDNQGLLHIPME
ncbi:MAG: RecQ family ATP-dependent DNA helicase [Bacteroidales bacterium]|nr:RecQ family ATP-dependent DNA helicase [Bacteroidales bacterium]